LQEQGSFAVPGTFSVKFAPPLPPEVVKALEKLENDGDYFFTSGRANWSRYLDTVFADAKVYGALAAVPRHVCGGFARGWRVHRKRLGAPRTFSVRITERHYRPWVKRLQKKLEEEVRKAWT
jgi:hypothetical protein